MAAQPVPTSTAQAFRGSVGVCTHPTYFDTVHAREPEIAKAIYALGIRHVRNGLAWSKDGPWNDIVWANMRSWGLAGVRSSWSLDRCALNELGKSLTERLAKCSQLDPLVPVGIEGTNEANMFCGGQGWETAERQYVAALFAAVRNHPDPRINRLSVVGPSFAYGPQSGVGNLEANIDFGNFHPYMGGEPPTTSRIAPQLDQYRVNFGNRPYVATECGYHTATAQARNPDGWPKSGAQAAVDERTQAVYTVRQLLEHFRQGIQRTYLYEAVDLRANLADSESNFGLLRNDLSPKPAALAVKRLLSAVGSSKPATVVPLKLGLVDVPVGVEWVAFQRRGGSYALAVWRPESCWDRLAQKRIPVGLKPLVLDLPQASSVNVKNVIRGDSVDLPASSWRVSWVLGDEPVVLTVR